MTMTSAECGGHHASALPLADALQCIRARVRPLTEVEVLERRDALGRVGAVQLCSSIAVPGCDNAAMDGYAVVADSCVGHESQRLAIVGRALAGHPYAGAVKAGECVRIMTGAPLPAGADTVLMQESVEVDGDAIRFKAPIQLGDNVRRSGEDVAPGDLVLAGGDFIGAAHLGVLASAGIGSVAVLRRPRVALLSTGDELREVGNPLAPSQLYDSNRENLFGMLSRAGAEVIDMGLVADDPSQLERSLLAAAERADLVISTGGASVGDADYVEALLRRLGHVDFSSVAIKPGRPTLFGELAGTVFFGLPGNPVSVSVTWAQLVRPALWQLSGASGEAPALTLPATCLAPLRTRRGRTEFQRGILSWEPRTGVAVVERAGRQGSGMLSSMTRANCFIVVPDDSGPVAAGTQVVVQPFGGLF